MYYRVYDNQLTDLPSDLHEVKLTLTRLEISNNPMRQLPLVILKLCKLRCLHAKDLMLTQLPRDFGEMGDLELLRLGTCIYIYIHVELIVQKC